eukprot:5605167-Amphidinium_carterae.2
MTGSVKYVMLVLVLVMGVAGDGGLFQVHSSCGAKIFPWHDILRLVTVKPPIVPTFLRGVTPRTKSPNRKALNYRNVL